MLYGHMHQLIGRMRSWRGLPTVAGQVFLLQAVLILALAAAAVAAYEKALNGGRKSAAI